MEVVEDKNRGSETEDEGHAKCLAAAGVIGHEGEGQHAQKGTDILKGGGLAADGVHQLLRLAFQCGGDEFRGVETNAPQSSHAGQAQGDADQGVFAPEWMLEEVDDGPDLLRGIFALASFALSL